MFPGRWPYYPESMWNYGWSAPAPAPHQPAVPLGQFCGSDPSFQQSQAQTQAQISAFQQQNALLNQQLHNQSQTHINHLQQLLPHHQVQQTTPTPPSVQPPPATPGSDPSYPQSQAQVQAQITALQQQNALLNQQLHNQPQTHINHLQQLLPHHQAQQQPTTTPPSVQTPPATPVPTAPEPPIPQVATPSPPAPPVPFNPDEMLQQMKTTFEASLATVVQKTPDRQSHHRSSPSSATQSLSHSVTQSLSHSVTQSLSHSVTQSLSHSVTQPLSHSPPATQPLSHSVTHCSHSVTHSFTHPLSHSVIQSFSHSATQPLSHSVT